MANGFKSGGRKKGSLNDGNDIVRKLARKHAKAAISELFTQMKTAPEKAVRVSAANALLDRGFGKPTQAVTGKVEANITVKLTGSDTEL